MNTYTQHEARSSAHYAVVFKMVQMADGTFDKTAHGVHAFPTDNKCKRWIHDYNATEIDCGRHFVAIALTKGSGYWQQYVAPILNSSGQYAVRMHHAN